MTARRRIEDRYDHTGKLLSVTYTDVEDMTQEECDALSPERVVHMDEEQTKRWLAEEKARFEKLGVLRDART